ncbi:FAD-linked oxidase [Streptomyces sulfonofaciens]|uniref:FAD-linked oxidase n=1 Tax=Streptomyces sulfonofaciens TaxID=68272 RepID=A0A919GLP0_9ACTN|nr:FAD-linked oxidase C-terminal domain-containing protein [Streptomyces sulfonofaciens]GHH86822.1 FAD-linked oxidase [Streptomyces sulfonofaciens]
MSTDAPQPPAGAEPAPPAGAAHPAPLRTALAELTARLPAGTLVTDPDVLAAHRSDRAPFCPSGTPAALVRARSTEQVSLVLGTAHRYRVPVVPQAARTGLAGGANAVDGCILLSVERMDRILEVDTVDQVAVAEAGVVNAVFSRAVAEHGLFYPPDPSSWEMSTLGGNAATNAGGLCCVKYGVTADFVRGLTVVLADGSVLRTGRRTAKGVAGYDLTHLFVGSEGTLGVITEVTLALRPAARAPLTAVAFFPDPAAACAAVADYMADGTRPSLLELMDRPTMDVVSAYRDLGFPPDAGAVLIAQSDRGDQAPGDLRRFAGTASRHGGDAVVAEDPAEAELLLAARRLVAVATERLGAYLADDVCVPRRVLADLVDGVAEIAREHGVRITCVAHAGDGNLHPHVLFDPADPAEAERAHRAFGAVMDLGLALGGTITGEHGVGVLKRDWLGKELGPIGLRVHRDIKHALDPYGILNPGKVLPAAHDAGAVH